MKPVSVVIPAHDAASSIAAVLASLAPERSVIEEILLIDDASSDDTARVAAKAAATDRLPLRVVSVSKRDAGAARNAGIEIAAAPWLYFIDADDAHLAGGLRALFAATVAKPDAGLVVGAYLRRVDGGPDQLIDAPRGYGPSPLANAANYLVDRCETINVGTALISRRAIGAKRFPERLPYEEDTLFWARLLSGAALATIDRPVMAYHVSRLRADDRLTRQPVRSYFAWRRVMRALANTGIGSDVIARREALLAIKIARVHYLRGELRLARRFLRLASRQPKDPKTMWRYWRYRLRIAATRLRPRRQNNTAGDSLSPGSHGI